MPFNRLAVLLGQLACIGTLVFFLANEVSTSSELTDDDGASHKPEDDTEAATPSANDAITDQQQNASEVDLASPSDITTYKENSKSGILHRHKRMKAFKELLTSRGGKEAEIAFLNKWGRSKEHDADFNCFKREFALRKAAKEHQENPVAHVPDQVDHKKEEE